MGGREMKDLAVQGAVEKPGLTLIQSGRITGHTATKENRKSEGQHGLFLGSLYQKRGTKDRSHGECHQTIEGAGKFDISLEIFQGLATTGWRYVVKVCEELVIAR
ncbi:MAG: hypothetical protein L6R38_000954 [Xanthoria sp. 2 TBL-2021]|nr:MAG: hypothetical protein L6R38_000954 [Xanthoria sp. 2 TBL-2021]